MPRICPHARTQRGRPAAGYFTKRLADAWLRDLLGQVRHGTLPGMTRTGATFADAAAEWLRYIEHDRQRKPSTVSGYQSTVGAQLLPTFGSATIEACLAGVDRASSTRVKALVLTHGIFQRGRKVWSLPANPVADVEEPPLHASGNIQVFSPDEVWALVRAADSEQDDAGHPELAAYRDDVMRAVREPREQRPGPPRQRAVTSHPPKHHVTKKVACLPAGAP